MKLIIEWLLTSGGETTKCRILCGPWQESLVPGVQGPKMEDENFLVIEEAGKDFLGNERWSPVRQDAQRAALWGLVEHMIKLGVWGAEKKSEEKHGENKLGYRTIESTLREPEVCAQCGDRHSTGYPGLFIQHPVTGTGVWVCSYDCANVWAADGGVKLQNQIKPFYADRQLFISCSCGKCSQLFPAGYKGVWVGIPVEKWFCSLKCAGIKVEEAKLEELPEKLRQGTMICGTCKKEFEYPYQGKHVGNMWFCCETCHSQFCESCCY